MPRLLVKVCCSAACWTAMAVAASAQDGDAPESKTSDRTTVDRQVQPVIDEVDKLCRERTVYMIGPTKARRLAELVRRKKPDLVVECGTAIGYSGLWIARELKAAGRGRLITIEIDEDRAKEAQANFERAGLADVVEVRVGDARQLTGRIKGPVDFLFIDCNFSNYGPCFRGIEARLAPGAVVVADNVGVGASGMKDYLDHVRSKYNSKTEWFDIDLPWGERDAMEITIIKQRDNGQRGRGATKSEEDEPRRHGDTEKKQEQKGNHQDTKGTE